MRRRTKFILIISVVITLFAGVVFWFNRGRFIQFFQIIFTQNVWIGLLIVGSGLIFVTVYLFGGWTEIKLKLRALRGLKVEEKLIDRDKAEQTGREYIERNWLTGSFLKNAKGTVLTLLCDVISPIYPKSITYHGLMFTSESVEGDRRIGLNKTITKDKKFGVVINRNNGEPESKLFDDENEMEEFVWKKHYASRPHEIKETEFEKEMKKAGAEFMGKKAAEEATGKKESKEEGE